MSRILLSSHMRRKDRTKLPGSIPSLGLDRREEQLAADPLQLLVNMDGSAVEIDVIPAQAEHLPAPQAVEDEQDKRGVQRVRRTSPYRVRTAQDDDRQVSPNASPSDGIRAGQQSEGLGVARLRHIAVPVIQRRDLGEL